MEPDNTMNAMISQLTELTERLVNKEIELEESEKRYYGVFDAVGDPLFVVDMESRNIITANQAARRIYGFSYDELRSMSYLSLISPTDHHGCEWSVCCEEGSHIIYHRRKSGVAFPVETTTSHFTYRGQHLCVVSVRDMTPNVKAEEALKESEERYRRLIEEIDALVWIKDLEGRHMFLSQHAAGKLFRCSPEDAVGKTDEQLISQYTPEVLELNKPHTYAITDTITLQEKTTCRFYMIIPSSSAPLLIDTRKTPVRDSDNTIVGVVAVAFDVTSEMDDILRGLPARLEKGIAEELVVDRIYRIRRT